MSGLSATKPIAAGVVLVYAAGELILQETLAERLAQYRDSGRAFPPQLWFPMYGTTKHVIWCGERGNASRYICTPVDAQRSNVELICNIDGAVGFRTTRAIAEGEFILWARDEISSEPLRRCAQCQKVDHRAGRCSGCKLTFYCSEDHQRLHWPEHRKECPHVVPEGVSLVLQQLT